MGGGSLYCVRMEHSKVGGVRSATQTSELIGAGRGGSAAKKIFFFQYLCMHLLQDLELNW